MSEIKATDEGVRATTSQYRLRKFGMLAILYLTFSIVLPLHRFDFDQMPGIEQAALIILPTIVFMFLQLLLTQSMVQLRLTNGLCAATAFAGIAIWVAFTMLAFRRHGLHHEILLFVFSALTGLSLTIALTCLGTLLSLIVKERNLLLPVALIAMPIDFLGAMTSSGFTHDMVKHSPKFVSSVSVSVPGITTHTSHGIGIGPIAFIGPGDVLFMALFFSAVQRFEMAEKSTFWWMYALLTFSMILVLRVPNFAVGALVPMGLAVIIANASQIKLQREELFAVAYAGVLVLILVGFFFWSSHRYIFHSH